MGKMTKLLSVFVIAGVVGAGTALAAGCGHKHKFSDEWTPDGADGHYRAAVCEHSDERADYSDHVYGDDYICDYCGYDSAVHVTEVKISASEKTLKKGQEFTLTANAEPSNATYNAISWSSDTPSVATVTGGTVKALAQGTAVITASAEGKKATCFVTVEDSTGITVSFDLNGHGSGTVQSALTDGAGKIPQPADPTDGQFDFAGWYDNAECNGSPVDFATKVFENNTTLYAYWVRDLVRATGVELDETEKTVKVGEKFALTATVLPTNATIKTVEWRSGNPQVLFVDGNGNVTAKSVGEALIFVKAKDGGWEESCSVKVEPDEFAVIGVKLDKETVSMTVGDTLRLNASVAPLEAKNTSVSWKSDNVSAAKVESDGTVTAMGAGKAVITVTTDEGGFFAYCVVTVYAPAPLPEKISENDFKTAVSATLNSTNFTAFMGNDEVEVDGDKNAIRFGGNYAVFNPAGKTVAIYTANGENSYVKRTQNCESFAQCMQIVLGLRSQLTKILSFTDYGAEILFNQNDNEYFAGKYTDPETATERIGLYAITFEDGKIKKFSINSDAPDWEFVSYGSTSVTLPSFENVTEEKSIEQARKEAQAKLDEAYNGLRTTHTRNGKAITEFYESAKAGIAAGKTAEALENCLKEFTNKTSFDSDEAIEAAIATAQTEIDKIKQANAGNYTKASNKTLFDELFKPSETAFEEAASVQAVNDYYNFYFVKDEDTGVSRFETDLAEIPTDGEIEANPELSELETAKQSAKTLLRESWEEYLAVNEEVNLLAEEYKNNIKNLWETTVDAIEAATEKQSVQTATRTFNFGRSKEVAKSQLVDYANKLIEDAGLDVATDAALISSIDDEVKNGKNTIDALNMRGTPVNGVLENSERAIDNLIFTEAPDKFKTGAKASITRYFNELLNEVNDYASEKEVAESEIVVSAIKSLRENAIVNDKSSEIDAATDNVSITNIVNNAKTEIDGLVADVKEKIDSAELEKAKESVKVWLLDDWEEYVAANELGNLVYDYQFNIYNLWTNAVNAVNSAKNKAAVELAAQLFLTAKDKEIAKSQIAQYFNDALDILNAYAEGKQVEDETVNEKIQEQILQFMANTIVNDKSAEVNAADGVEQYTRIVNGAKTEIDSLVAAVKVKIDAAASPQQA